MLAIRFELPTRVLVFYGTVIVLELGIALLARLMILAMLVETGNGKPRSISTRLTGLRVETGGKGIVMGKPRTVALEVILGDSPSGFQATRRFCISKMGRTSALVCTETCK